MFTLDDETRRADREYYAGMKRRYPHGRPTSAHLHFDRSYAPCGVLIVRDGASHLDESQTVLIQGDDDMMKLAFDLGWHHLDDQEWTDFLRDCAGTSYPVLLDYFTNNEA